MNRISLPSESLFNHVRRLQATEEVKQRRDLVSSGKRNARKRKYQKLMADSSGDP
jgi:hypothetical protein